MSSGKGVHLVRLDPSFLPLPRLFKPEQPEEHKEEESSLADQLERAYAMYQNRFTLQYTDVLLRTFLAEELDVDDLVEEHFVGGLVKEKAEDDGAGLLRAVSEAEEGDEDEGELKDREEEERMILQRHGRPDRCNAQAGGLFRRDGCVPCLLPPPSLAADGMGRRESTSRRGDAGKRETDRL